MPCGQFSLPGTPHHTLTSQITIGSSSHQGFNTEIRGPQNLWSCSRTLPEKGLQPPNSARNASPAPLRPSFVLRVSPHSASPWPVRMSMNQRCSTLWIPILSLSCLETGQSQRAGDQQRIGPNREATRKRPRRPQLARLCLRGRCVEVRKDFCSNNRHPCFHLDA